MNIKRDKVDKLFSHAIRERDNWTCQRCQKYFPEGIGRKHIHCSHIFSRRHRATRWEPYNAVAHCFKCHEYLGGNPVIFNAWAREYWGDYIVDMLDEKHNNILKITKKDKADHYKYLKLEYARLVNEREAGAEGVLKFTGFF